MRKTCSFLLCLVILSLWVTACTPYEMSESTPVTSTVTGDDYPVVNTTVTPTRSLTPILSLTQNPGLVELPSITLSPQEEENALLELLETNGNCTGKCIGGIYPDEMTVQEAVNVMSQWGMIRTGKNYIGDTYFSVINDILFEQVSINFYILTKSKAIQNIDSVIFEIHGIPEINYTLAENVWLANWDTWRVFQLDKLLQTYGAPSYVRYLFTLNNVEVGSSLEGRTIVYSMELLYEQENMVISISGTGYYDGEQLSICPSKDPHSLMIEINPDRPINEFKNIYPITWEGLTDSTLDVFYQYFTDEPNPDMCFTTTLEKIRDLDYSFMY